MSMDDEPQSAYDLKGISAADAETLQNERAKAVREARRLENEAQSQAQEFGERHGDLHVTINSPHQAQCRGNKVALTIAPTPQPSVTGLPPGVAGDILYHNGSAWVVLHAPAPESASKYVLGIVGTTVQWLSTTAC